MKTTLLLVGLFVALQLSAQAPKFSKVNNRFRGSEISAKAGEFTHSPNRTHQQFAKISDKDNAAIAGTLNDFFKTNWETENTLSLKRAELRLLMKQEVPNMGQINGKMAEINDLETAKTLDKLKLGVKLQSENLTLASGMIPGRVPGNTASIRPGSRRFAPAGFRDGIRGDFNRTIPQGEID